MHISWSPTISHKILGISTNDRFYLKQKYLIQEIETNQKNYGSSGIRTWFRQFGYTRLGSVRPSLLDGFLTTICQQSRPFKMYKAISIDLYRYLKHIAKWFKGN